MPCCCAAKKKAKLQNQTVRKEDDFDDKGDDLVFSKIRSSGFDKERQIHYYYEDADGDQQEGCKGVNQEEGFGDKTISEASHSLKDLDSTASDNENLQDMLFVDGNESDYDACEDEDSLMERVWLLLKPPRISKPTNTVPARRIQVVKERLSSSVRKLPALSEVLKEEVERNIKMQERKNDERYQGVSNVESNVPRISCQEDTKIDMPECAFKLGEIL